MLNDAQPAPPSSTQGQGTPRCCWMEILLKESEHLYSGEARLKSPMYDTTDQLWLICLFQVSVAFDGRIELTNTMFPRQVGPDVHDQKKWLILPKWQPPHCQVGKRKQNFVNYLGNEPVVWVKRVHEHFATDRHPMPILLPIVHSVATMQCGLWCIWQHQICVNADHVFYFQTDKLLPTPLQSPSQTDNDVNKE